MDRLVVAHLDSDAPAGGQPEYPPHAAGHDYSSAYPAYPPSADPYGSHGGYHGSPEQHQHGAYADAGYYSNDAYAGAGQGGYEADASRPMSTHGAGMAGAGAAGGGGQYYQGYDGSPQQGLQRQPSTGQAGYDQHNDVSPSVASSFIAERSSTDWSCPFRPTRTITDTSLSSPGSSSTLTPVRERTRRTSSHHLDLPPHTVAPRPLSKPSSSSRSSLILKIDRSSPSLSFKAVANPPSSLRHHLAPLPSLLIATPPTESLPIDQLLLSPSLLLSLPHHSPLPTDHCKIIPLLCASSPPFSFPSLLPRRFASPFLQLRFPALILTLFLSIACSSL